MILDINEKSNKLIKKTLLKTFDLQQIGITNLNNVKLVNRRYTNDIIFFIGLGKFYIQNKIFFYSLEN